MAFFKGKTGFFFFLTKKGNQNKNNNKKTNKNNTKNKEGLGPSEVALWATSPDT